MTAYLIESMLCFAVLIALYELVIKSGKHFHVNRGFLLFIPLFSLSLPLVNYQIMPTADDQIATQEFVLVDSLTPIQESITTTTTNILYQSNSWTPSVVESIYFFVTSLLLLKLVFQIALLARKCLRAEVYNYQGVDVRLFDWASSPFTFFKSICVSRTSVVNAELSLQQLRHEQAHQSQLHSVDVVFIEIIQAFMWFNPLIYLLNNRVRLNHEYLADEAAINACGDKATYANQLINLTTMSKTASLASAFNQKSTIEKRLLMLTKSSSTTKRILAISLIAIASSLLFVGSAMSIQTAEVDDLTRPGEVHADSLMWSSENNKVYLSGSNVLIRHGDNDANVDGRASYLGAVSLLIINGEIAPRDVDIDIAGKTVTVVKLKTDDAQQEYGIPAAESAIKMEFN